MKLDLNRISPSTPYVFVLDTNDSGRATAVTWLTASVGFEHSLDCRDAHVEAQERLPIANRRYRPGLCPLPAYNILFLALVSDFFVDFQFPSSIKICLWWSAEDSETDFAAYLGRLFQEGKTGLHAIFTTSSACNLEQHCRGLDPMDPKVGSPSSPDAFSPLLCASTHADVFVHPLQTADVLILATPRAEAECANLFGQDSADYDARGWWEEALKVGF